MKQLVTLWMLGLTCGWPMLAGAQLRLVSDRQPQYVFAGNARKISVVFSNSSVQNFKGEIRTRIFQAGSATAILVSENPWKQLEVPAGATVLDSAALDFPAVNAGSKFLVQWLENTNRVIGKTEVLVYPTNLLRELKPLLNGEDWGVLDPNGALKPVLKQNGVEFLDLGETALEDFSGKLAVVGPFQSRAQMREGLAQTIQRIARKGTEVVWIQPPDPKNQIKPSFYFVPEGKGAVVVVQPELVADFSSNPRSQLNLIYFCKLALNPQPPGLPDFNSQP